jgi:hypothetical protein
MNLELVLFQQAMWYLGIKIFFFNFDWTIEFYWRQDKSSFHYFSKDNKRDYRIAFKLDNNDDRLTFMFYYAKKKPEHQSFLNMILIWYYWHLLWKMKLYMKRNKV